MLIVGAATLIFFRLLPIFVVAPVGAFRRVPVMVRVIVTIMLSLILTAGVLANETAKEQYVVNFGNVLSEFLVGMSLAFSFHAATAAVQTMGQVIDMQIGFAAGALFDPSTEQMVSPTGEVFSLALVMVFVALDIHHDLLHAFSHMLSLLPPGAEVSWSENWFKILASHFVLGLIIVSPVILVLWLADLMLALVSRSLPQAQIYFVGLPAKIGIGLITLSWFVKNGLEPFNRLYIESLQSWNLMFEVA